MGVLHEVLYWLVSCTALGMAWWCVSSRFSDPRMAPALALQFAAFTAATCAGWATW